MRLDMDGSVVGPATTMLVVTGIIDWSTIERFRARLAACVARPRPNVLVDLTGVLSWSLEAQAVLAHADLRARLKGGRLAAFGLAPVPTWQASGDAGLVEPSMSRAQAADLAMAPAGAQTTYRR